MQEVYRRKLLVGMMILLALFGLIIIATLLKLSKGHSILGTGISYNIENWTIIILAFLSMLKVIQEIVRIEHA